MQKISLRDIFEKTRNPSPRVGALILLLLGLGDVFVLNYIFRLKQFDREKPELEPPALAVEGEPRLEALLRLARFASARRAAGLKLAEAMAKTGRYPFGRPEEGTAPPDERPPKIVVRGIMTMGGVRTAVMDVAGEGSGLIVREGGRFLKGEGRVLRIARGEVTVRWGGRDWKITF